MHRPRRRLNKRKGGEEPIAIDVSDGEERKEDKRSRVEPASASAAAASSSSAAAAAVASSSVAAASGPCFVAASTAFSSRPLADLEKLECAQCADTFECVDSAGLLPRNLPCGHVLCSNCIKNNLTRTPGHVHCPENHGLQKISPPASAAPAMADWLNQLLPAKDLVAAIGNQRQLMEQLAEKGRARCCHSDCAADVTHYCPDCGDLCSTHEHKRHALAAFQSHKSTTMLIAQKSASLHSKIAAPASAIRSQADARLVSKQQQLRVAEDQLRQLDAQTQQKRKEVQAIAHVVGQLQQTADQMRAANDSAVLVMEADRLEAEQLRVSASAAAARPAIDSTVLNALPDVRVADLQTFLGPSHSLTKATLIFRASRDGFKAKDWWLKCGGKSRLLTIIKVKRNGFVCGAFTPFQWSLGEPAKAAFISDPTAATFLFSLVNAHGRAVRLRLKQSEKANAGKVFPGCGPKFGAADLGLMYDGNSADVLVGNWAQPRSFEFDCVADGGAPVAYDKTLLAGDDGRGENCVDFGAAEIESWQL